MIEKDLYSFNTKIKTGIMWSIYTQNGLINEVDFSLLNDDTLDAYLEGALISTVRDKKKDGYEVWYVGLMFSEKCYKGYIICKDREKLKNYLVDAMIDYRNPKYSIVRV